MEPQCGGLGQPEITPVREASFGRHLHEGQLRLCQGSYQDKEVVHIGLDTGGQHRLVFLGAEHQMREHLSQLAGVKRMMGMPMVAIVMIIITVMVTIAMTGQFCLKNKATLPYTIVVMVRDNGVQQDDCTRQRGHYLCRQMLHSMTFTLHEALFLHSLSRCKDTHFN